MELEFNKNEDSGKVDVVSEFGTVVATISLKYKYLQIETMTAWNLDELKQVINFMDQNS